MTLHLERRFERETTENGVSWMKTRRAVAVAVPLVGMGLWIAPAFYIAPHDPAKAVANLYVHPDVAATLFASEPMITNPTNLDIDVRGRVWVCDVMSYRGNSGKRAAGDRILILEDT